MALAAKYRLIDRDYKLAVLNRVLCHVTYLEDGSSHTMWKQYAKNPRGFLYWRQLCLTYPAAATRTVLDSIHYDAACFLAKEPALMLRSPKKVLTMLCTPLGAGLSVLIRLMAARTERKAQKEAVCPENHPLLLVWSRTTAGQSQKVHRKLAQALPGLYDFGMERR